MKTNPLLSHNLCVPMLALLIAMLAASDGQAATISVVQRDGESAGLGTLDIFIDTENEIHFTQGGISLAVTSSLEGVLRFTDAEVHSPTIFGAERWSIARASGIFDDRVEDLFGASVMSYGLDEAIPGNPIQPDSSTFLYASINYELLGEASTGTFISVGLSQRVDPLYDRGVDVTGQVRYEGLCVGGECQVPSPKSPTAPLIAIPEPVAVPPASNDIPLTQDPPEPSQAPPVQAESTVIETDVQTIIGIVTPPVLNVDDFPIEVVVDPLLETRWHYLIDSDLYTSVLQIDASLLTYRLIPAPSIYDNVLESSIRIADVGSHGVAFSGIIASQALGTSGTNMGTNQSGNRIPEPTTATLFAILGLLNFSFGRRKMRIV